MKRKQILQALFVMLAIPSLLCRVVEYRVLRSGKPQREETPTTATEEQVNKVQQEKRIPVLTDTGEIQDMELNEYLLCVVLGEMPASFQMEALKAQTVVARTYTLKHNLLRDKHDDGELCTDHTCCQAFCAPDAYLEAGHTADQLERVKQAVRETENQVLVYEGSLIDATYFSSSGGRTEAAVAVWGSDVPYLQAVDSPGEEIASDYVKTVQFSSEEFTMKLGENLSGQPETWFGLITYTDGGGVDTIEIGGKVYTGKDLRSRLGLRSTAFLISAVGDTVTVTTRGFGHRVGMSQYGAEAMAQNGSTCSQILSHYYPGTTLENWTE